MNSLKGIKTYIVAAITILTGIVKLIDGDWGGIELILAGFAMITIRQAIKTESNNVKQELKMQLRGPTDRSY